ncbi:MAG: hypothetical protein KF699_11410 [Phycisphaeraceae bacterium]|nr:hypothetical protein [Phycisphaeraceae bacterium]MBX3406540.1 hypothetical protein [Phycisphaeraceae bacterium]
MSAEGKGIMRSLGEFVGHIARAVATDPRQNRRTVTHTETVEQPATTADGRAVILRRTVIEEVEMRGESEPPRSTR